MRAKEIISELYGTYDLRSAPVQSVDELSALMAKNGYKEIGAGEYGAVYGNDRLNQVIKIYNDECYEAFVKLCKSRPGDPHLPKFRGNSVRLRNGARMIRLERLTPAKEATISQVHLLYSIAQRPEEKEMWGLEGEKGSMVETLEALIAGMPTMCRVDLNAGNIMMRGQTAVIIDPFNHATKDGWASGKL